MTSNYVPMETAVIDFAHKWGPELGTPEYSEFIEDLRVVCVAAQMSFRSCQKANQFVDDTGDAFLTLIKMHKIK
jgi:hypothetical protein